MGVHCRKFPNTSLTFHITCHLAVTTMPQYQNASAPRESLGHRTIGMQAMKQNRAQREGLMQGKRR
jgi:hypothetical protein